MGAQGQAHSRDAECDSRWAFIKSVASVDRMRLLIQTPIKTSAKVLDQGDAGLHRGHATSPARFLTSLVGVGLGVNALPSGWRPMDGAY